MICDGDDSAVAVFAELIGDSLLKLGHKCLQLLFRAAGDDKFDRVAERGGFRGAFIDDAEVRFFELAAAKIVQRLGVLPRSFVAEGQIVGNFDHIVVVHGRIGVESHKSEQERARNEDNQADCEADEQTLFRDGLTHLPFPPS